jgi:hypothetical protein
MSNQKGRGQGRVECRRSTSSTNKSDEVYCETDQGQWVSVVRGFLHGLAYGEVVLTVHDSRVVQVECTQKVRF